MHSYYNYFHNYINVCMHMCMTQYIISYWIPLKVNVWVERPNEIIIYLCHGVLIRDYFHSQKYLNDTIQLIDSMIL